MTKISKTKIAAGVFWLEVPEAELFVLCGCPADSIKHLMKAGKIYDYEIEEDTEKVNFDFNPNFVVIEKRK